MSRPVKRLALVNCPVFNSVKMTMNPYNDYVAAFARLLAAGKSLPLGGIAPHDKSRPAANAPAALIFSPHPDDECIIGGLALRLMRESGIRVINVAVTLGSREDRRQPRWQELKNACAYLGFGLESATPDGLEKISVKTRVEDPPQWAAAVKIISVTLARHQPRVVFFPHEFDWNGTHIGTHFLVMDALHDLPKNFECLIVETEFWGQMASPNLMVESSVADVADLLAALSFHVGEVRRNPYHLRLPAWLQDNVRRGAELVGGQGGAAPDFNFATLYRLRRWKNGRAENIFPGGRQISIVENPGGFLDSIR
jgi:N-acetylglucosamine malate deacetylase 1